MRKYQCGKFGVPKQPLIEVGCCSAHCRLKKHQYPTMTKVDFDSLKQDMENQKSKCLWCGKDIPMFMKRNGRTFLKKRLYCSKLCGDLKLRHITQSKESIERWREQVVGDTSLCPVCGKVMPKYAKRKGVFIPILLRFCSIGCTVKSHYIKKTDLWNQEHANDTKWCDVCSATIPKYKKLKSGNLSRVVSKVCDNKQCKNKGVNRERRGRYKAGLLDS